MLSLSEIRVFLIAAETENFSETARRVGISQPAVSMQIRSLEEQLGVDLFHRSGRSVALTDAGEALIPLARDLIHRAISVQEAMASMVGEVVGLLKFVCTTTAGKYVLPRLLARFQEAHPRVEMACLVVPRAVALARLSEGEAHIGLASVLETMRGLEYRPFMTDRVALITPPDHPWATRGRPVLPEELPTERFISREDTSGTAFAVREALAWHDLTPEDLPNSMTLGNSEAIRMAVQEGLGLGFVSTLVASEAVESGNLAIVPVEGMEVTTTLYMIRNPGVPRTTASTAFWDFSFDEEHHDLRSRANPALS
jgi:DNA-binding transcriptional LysR family regulator